MQFLVTAGPTREPIDPVRFLSNRSSGKMGYAIARAALEAGHDVILVSGPVSLDAPAGLELIRVETALEMYEAVATAIGRADAAVFCAAVADYRIEEPAPGKIKKTEDRITLTLVKNPDILGSARTDFGFRGILAGFAAETGDLERHALEKLERKGCDLIVANDVSRTDIAFDRDDNEVTVFYRGGRRESLPLATKDEIARTLVARIVALEPEPRKTP